LNVKLIVHVLLLIQLWQGGTFNVIPTRLTKGRNTISIIASNMATMDSPSAERNKDPIWSVLSTVVNSASTTTTSNDCEGEVNNNKRGNTKKSAPYKVLEIAAGCGVHTLYFTSEFLNNFPHLDLSWYPTDPDESCRCSIQDRIRNTVSESVRESVSSAVALTLSSNGTAEERDCSDVDSPIRMTGEFNLMICINMIHISPWEATIGLMKVASTCLTEGGILYCYGPFKVDGKAMQSNLDFDVALKSRNSAWGLREKQDVIELAVMNGLYLKQTVEMPANNLSLIFCKDGV